MRSALLILLLVAVLLLLLPIAGCLAPEPEMSDWRWKQFSPEYQPPVRSDRERGSIY